jgi:hypothetical protein
MVMRIGAEFSKFQRLPRFYLQINLSDNFKYSKRRSQQRIRIKNTRNKQSGTTVGSVLSAVLEFYDSP